MLPWGHAAVGYLCYTLYTRLRYREPPTGATVVALAIGTQFPDLIDKPLAWTFGVLPSGRSLAHSLLVLSVVAAVLYWVTQPRSEQADSALFAFLVGWTSHLFADGYTILLGRQTCVNYLFWPLTACGYDEEGRSIIAFFLTLQLTDGLLIGLGLAVVAGGVWLLDGAPGLRFLLKSVKQRRR